MSWLLKWFGGSYGLCTGNQSFGGIRKFSVLITAKIEAGSSMIDCHMEVGAWPTHSPIMMDMSMTVISHVMTLISELGFVQTFNPDIYCLEWIRESLSLYHIEVRVCQPRITRWLLTRKARKAVWMRRAPHSWRFLYRCLEESIRIFSTFSVTIANFGSSLTSLKYSSSSLADSSTLLLFSADVFHSTHRRCFSPPGFFCKCHMPMDTSLRKWR